MESRKGSSQDVGSGSQIELMCLPAGEVPFYLVHDQAGVSLPEALGPLLAPSSTVMTLDSKALTSFKVG